MGVNEVYSSLWRSAGNRRRKEGGEGETYPGLAKFWLAVKDNARQSSRHVSNASSKRQRETVEVDGSARTHPGEMQLTRMPLVAHSTARDAQRCRTAAFEAL